MPTIHQDSESFHHFAIVRLARAPAVQSFDELFVEWRDSQSQDEINEAIRCGLADIEAGRYEPAEKSAQRVRERFGFEA